MLYYQYIPEGKEYPILCRRLVTENNGWVETVVNYVRGGFGRDEILLDWNDIARQYGGDDVAAKDLDLRFRDAVVSHGSGIRVGSSGFLEYVHPVAKLCLGDEKLCLWGVWLLFVTKVGMSWSLRTQSYKCKRQEAVGGMPVKKFESDGNCKDRNTDMDLNQAIKMITNLELQISIKDNEILKLETEVDKLRRLNEMQTLHLVGGFESIFKVHDGELEKLVAENAELRKTIFGLEEQLANQEVHNVTQTFRDVTVVDGNAINEVGEAMQIAKRLDDSPCEGGNVVVSNEVGRNVTVVGQDAYLDTGEAVVDALVTEVVVISPIMAKSGRVIEGPTSFFHNIKSRVKKELKLPNFEYPVVRGWRGKGLVESGLGIWLNRLAVWKMLTADGKKRIIDAYDCDGDGAVMWVGNEEVGDVYATNVLALVRHVIDTYTV
ncbi:hypothetical protein LOK49_LG01G02487 [Camellia lanceoleosa]|uniref:Uncharacterized protein n=1 Tax=Camellia lanceoleosa TaxID=1840588 RepID=A0ACC0J525_9ERIC|nr:hypothetical protein LOK49_LG01G02487 [Camellia lanceoleosa]